MRLLAILKHDARGSALIEFAICLPLLVVFVVGIYDFSGGFNQRQKIEHAAQQAAIVAGAQPMTDIESTNVNPQSLQPVLQVVFTSLAANNVLPSGNFSSCTVGTPTHDISTLQWSYSISGCSPDPLVITIDRGWVPGGAQPTTVGTKVSVSYPYHWRFNSVIQLLVPGAAYAATTNVTETASVHNQM